MSRGIRGAHENPQGRTVNTTASFFFDGFVLWRFANRKIVERWATLTSPAEIQS
jgi:hypothetical protein